MLKISVAQFFSILLLFCISACNSLKTSNSDACNAIGLKLIGGQACDLGDNPERSAVVRLIIENDEESFLCTGTVIDDKTILTAAHCFSNPETDRVKVETFVSSSYASSVKIHPSYVYFGNAIYDLALVFMDNSVGVGTHPLLTSRAVSKNEEAVVDLQGTRQ